MSVFQQFMQRMPMLTGGNLSPTAVDVRPSTLSGAPHRRCDFSFADRTTDGVEKQFPRIDGTKEFPFLMTKMSAYFDR
jgi:hypothetical protein